MKNATETTCLESSEKCILVSVLSAFTNLGEFYMGKHTHKYIMRNITENSFAVQTELGGLYLKVDTWKNNRLFVYHPLGLLHNNKGAKGAGGNLTT